MSSDRSKLNLNLESALFAVEQWLQDFASSEAFLNILTQVFGHSLNWQQVQQFQQQWRSGDFSSLPQIEIRTVELQTAKAAYADATHTIYLSEPLVQGNSDDLIATLLEEIGHFVDAQVNAIDTPGDEGDIFSRLIRGQLIPADEFYRLRQEDDTAIFLIDGKLIPAEQSQVSDSGGFEGSRQVLKLDTNGGGKAIVSFEHFTIPDQIQLRYEGQNILDTGFVPGRRSIEVDIPSGKSNELEVILTTNDEDTLWNYTVTSENKAYLVFRESDSGIPRWDHVGLYFNGKVYEAHPGYEPGFYPDLLENKPVYIPQINGVQNVHTLGSFISDPKNPGQPFKWTTQEIPASLAQKMVDFIQGKLGTASYTFENGWLQGALLRNQKGENQFTCVGLIEWAAERAGLNGGQGFLPATFEQFLLLDRTPIGNLFGGTGFLLPNHLLTFSSETTTEWLQGAFDPVDFILTDPLGRRLGHTAATGTLNEIPGALYSGDGELEQFTVFEPLPGEYRLELVGLGENAVATIDGSLSSEQSFNGFLGNGEARTLTTTVPATLRRSGITDLAIVRTDSLNAVRLGQRYSYRLTVTNQGRDAAAGVILRETLPAGVTFASGTTSVGQTVRVSNGVVSTYLGSLGQGSSAFVDLTVDPIAAGNLISRTTVTSDQADSNITNNTLISTKTVAPTPPASADLELTQTVNNALPSVGETIRLTLTLANKGPGTASGVKITNLLPAGLSFISAQTVQGSYSNLTGLWDVGNLRSNAARTLTLTARVTTAGRIVNTAEVIALSEQDPDSKPANQANEDDRTSLTLFGIPSLDVFGTAPPAITFKRGNRGLNQRGTSRSDRLNGTNRSDQFKGGKGNDALLGGKQRDLLLGEAGNDRLNGQAEADVLVGGAGNDELTGGTGADFFVLNQLTNSRDQITDFKSSQDLIDLRPIFAASPLRSISPPAQFFQFIQLVQVGKNTEIRLDTDGAGIGTTFSPIAVLKNTGVNTLTTRNFVIA